MKVKALVTDFINKLQAVALSEASQKSYRDEGESKATEEEEDLEAEDP